MSANYVSHLIQTVKARDAKRSEDFARAQYERDLKIQSQEETFDALVKWIENALGQIQSGLGRPAVRFMATMIPGTHHLPSFKLIGETGDTSQIEVVRAKDGKIQYSGPLVFEGRQSFNPSVEHGDHVQWFSTKGPVTIEEMGALLLSIVMRVE